MDWVSIDHPETPKESIIYIFNVNDGEYYLPSIDHNEHAYNCNENTEFENWEILLRNQIFGFGLLHDCDFMTVDSYI